MGKRQFFLQLIVFFTLFLSATKQASAADYRAYKLANFLATQSSPLVYYAPDFVYIADKYGLDYRLLPAIAGVESTFARNYISGTYNAYGWGGGQIYFNSWTDGMEKIAAGLKNNYINRGAKTIEQIGRIYNPQNPIRWAGNVRYFMDQIENVSIAPYLVVTSEPISRALPLTI